MNPWVVARASLRQSWRVALAMALLVALATAMGVGVGVLDRGLRQAAVRTADMFDLVVGAPGGAAQLVLAAVYLQPDTVPLLEPALVARVLAEPEAAWSSPIGFGDQWRGHPIVGVAPAFVSRGDTRALAEGRAFASDEEAVVGSAVPLRLGGKVQPQHGLVEVPGGGHAHAETEYTVVGRLSPGGTPWDRAILVPIESVWEVHGLGRGHPEAPGPERVGPPYEQPAGVPAIVVKPRTFGGAYQLRARYRTASSTAVFPGEVLAGLFRTMGDVRALLSGMAALTAALVIGAVFLAYSAIVAGRRREIAMLRAIGAPARFILAALWLELGVVLLGGVAAGVALGWFAARLAAGALAQAAGAPVPVALGWGEFALAASILAGGLCAAVVPALVGGRAAPGAALKQ